MILNLKEFKSIYSRLICLERFNTTPRIFGESVAEHMYLVALISSYLSYNNSDLDKERVLSLALIHDSEEAYCFPAGTKILVERIDRPHKRFNYLSTKPIEKICTGERVLSYNEQTGEKEYRVVVSTGSRMTNRMSTMKFSNGNELDLTSDHRVYTLGKGWVRAFDLKVGDKVIQKRWGGLALRIYNLLRTGRTLEEIYGEERGSLLHKTFKNRLGSIRYLSLLPEVRKRAYESWLQTKEERPELAQRAIKSRANGVARKCQDNPDYRRQIRRQLADGAERLGGYSKINKENQRKAKERLGVVGYTELMLGNLGRYHEKPTKLETDFDEYLQRSFPGMWRYVGDYQLRIVAPGGQILYPDFVHTKNFKKLLEIYGVYWKEQNYGSIGNYEQIKGELYKSAGYETLFISDGEFYSGNGLFDKVASFQFNPDTEIVSVIDIAPYTELRRVYNITVEHNYNYFAEGILVHNSGDITANIKRFHPGVEKALSEAAHDFLDILLSGLESNISKYWKECWWEYKQQKSPESKIVKIADLLATFIYAAIEAETGNRAMAPIAGNVVHGLRERGYMEYAKEAEELLEDIGTKLTEGFVRW